MLLRPESTLRIGRSVTLTALALVGSLTLACGGTTDDRDPLKDLVKPAALDEAAPAQVDCSVEDKVQLITIEHFENRVGANMFSDNNGVAYPAVVSDDGAIRFDPELAIEELEEPFCGHTHAGHFETSGFPGGIHMSATFMGSVAQFDGIAMWVRRVPKLDQILTVAPELEDGDISTSTTFQVNYHSASNLPDGGVCCPDADRDPANDMNPDLRFCIQEDDPETEEDESCINPNPAICDETDECKFEHIACYDESTGGCWDAFGVAVGATEAWRLVKIPWSELRQQGWGHQLPWPDLEKPSNVQISLSNGNYNLYIDDLSFYIEVDQ